MSSLDYKIVYLLRHATADTSSDGGDKHRVLSSEGVLDSEFLGKYMKNHDICPDCVLCSTAQRTRETLQGIEKSICFKHTEFLDVLYDGDMDDYLSALRMVSNDYHSVLIIAHNPIIYRLALSLICGETPENLQYGYAPATLSAFRFPVERWMDIKMGHGILENVFTLENIRGQARPTQWM